MSKDTELWHALQHSYIAFFIHAKAKPDLHLKGFLPQQLKRLIQTKAYSNGTLNVLRRLRENADIAGRFLRMYENMARIFAGRKTYSGLTDKDRLRYCFNILRAKGALASSRLAGPKSVPANAAEIAKGPGVFFISQSDYDQFIDINGMITRPLAISYFCTAAVKRDLIDTLFSFGFGVLVPNVANYRDHVLMLQSSAGPCHIDKLEA